MIINMNTSYINLKKTVESSIKDGIYLNNKYLSLEYIEGQESDVAFNYDLVKNYLDEINRLYPDNNFKISVTYKKGNHIIDTNECKEFEKIDNYLRENLNSELFISNKGIKCYGFRKTLSANRKIDGVAESIKNATNNGEPLSNFEKFMIAYEFVTQYAYNEGGDYFHTTTSHWVQVIEGDKIVCAGYASLLSELCNRIFAAEEVKVLEQGLSVYDKNTNKYMGGHANNIIFIKDDKYNIDGLFYIDSCWDSIKNYYSEKPQSYCCIPLKDVMYNKKYFLNFSEKGDKELIHFYLSQYKDYRDSFEKIKGNDDYKIGDIEEEFKEYVSELRRNNNVDAIKYYVFDGIEGDISAIDKYNAFNFVIELHEYQRALETKIKKDFSDIFEKYKDTIIPNYLPSPIIDHYNLQPHLDNLSSEEYDACKIKESLEIIAKAFNDEKVKKITYQMLNDGIGTQNLQDVVQQYMVYSLVNQKRIQHREKISKITSETIKKDVKTIINNINKKANVDCIPIQAFINSYKIIGRMKGLEKEELAKYIKNRIIKSIEKTNESFDSQKCSNCFSKTKIEDIEKGAIKLK